MPNPTSEEKQFKWKNLIEQQRQSGLSIEKWCLQNQIHPHVFHYWKAKLFPRQLQKTNFTELNIKHSPDTISLETRGLRVRVAADCDPHMRKQLFALLGGWSC
jgi:hypothetical protein